MKHSQRSRAIPHGLFREELIGSAPARTTATIFKNLPRVNRGELIADDPVRHSQATRLTIDRNQGSGVWEFYRLQSDVYVVAADCVYDTARVETVPGEGLVEFHLRVRGELNLRLAGEAREITVTGPQLLILYQPPGVDYSEEVVPNLQDTCVSLYCKPEFISDLVRRNGIGGWPMLDEIEAHAQPTILWKLLPLSVNLVFVAHSLLDNPFRKGVRLLHAEAKALDLLCDVLHSAELGVSGGATLSERELRQLEAARRILTSQLGFSRTISDIASSVAMSPSKLKRMFKARYGVTVFDYGLECRMRHAVELLRGPRLSVGQVAHAVGYRHQTSFAAAFKEHFGFSPRDARTKIR
ncbi:MAG: helix-turn-helix transcriptional regulator [Steroidobacteraceae bacterium]